MRLAFVHGINNESRSPDDIREMWWGAIVQGWEDIGLTPKARPDIDVGYYADILAAAVAGRDTGAVAQGATPSSSSHGRAFLDAYLEAADIGASAVAQELRAEGVEAPEVVSQGLFQEILVDSASAIERLLRRRGKWLASKFLTQATHYIEDEGLAAQIAVTVRKALFDDHDQDVLVISHSLGTVVSYRLLAGDPRLRNRNVPLFVTLGSPLGIGMMEDILPPHDTIQQPPIGAWVNGYRPDDFVALDRGLTPDTIGLPGIINVREGLIEEGDKHSIEAYLRSPAICARIHSTLP